MNVYVSNKWEGIPVETDEMKPFWFKTSDIPYEQMFADDKYWLPLVVEGKRLNANFEFDEAWKLLNYKIIEIQDHNILKRTSGI